MIHAAANQAVYDMAFNHSIKRKIPMDFYEH